MRGTQTVLSLIAASYLALTGAAPAWGNDAAWQLVAVGDILLGGSAEPELKGDYGSPFSNYVDILQGADVTYGNFEGPVGVKGAPVPGKTFTFQMQPAVLPVLRDVGFDVLHLANNHILDFGPESLAETIDLIDGHGFARCGAGENVKAARQPATVTTDGGVRFAFLCYSNTFPEEFWAGATSPGTAFGHEAWVRADVAKAKADGANVIIAAFHWGAELMTAPKDYQRHLAQAAIAAGATAVLGHHPHVLQPLDLIDGRPVAYSLGNFVFGSYSKNVKTSALLRLSGSGDRVTEIAVLPIDVYNPVVNFHPKDLPSNAARDVARFLLGRDAKQDGRWWVQRLTE